MRHHILSPIVSFAALSLVGCASPQVVIKDAQLVPAKDASERTKVLAGKTFAIVSVEDQRTGSSEFGVGTAGTGVRNKPTPVELELPVVEVVKNQIERELKTRGLESGDPGDVKLRVKIQELNLSEHRDGLKPEASICNAKLEVNVQTENKNKPQQFNWTGKVMYQSRGTLIDTTNATGATLASCLNLMVEKMVTNADFKQAMTR